MPAGKYRHFITLEQRTLDADGSVGITQGYIVADTVWAEMMGVRGAQYIASVQIENGPTHCFIMRRRAMDDFNFINYENRRFRVHTVRDPDGLRRELEVLAEELAAEAT